MGVPPGDGAVRASNPKNNEYAPNAIELYHAEKVKSEAIFESSFLFAFTH